MLDVIPLFEPLHAKHLTLRNRIVMPPMETNYGLDTEAARAWYGRRAAGGVGLVIVEATNVFKFGADLTAANLAPLVQAIHAGGAAAAIQLFPGVRGQEGAPSDLSLAEIRALVAQYAAASRICVAAGFDGIEPHGAHGYLLNRFFSPVHNQRTDAYGESLAGRMRLALEIVAAVRPALAAAGGLLFYRHTPVGDGYGIAESLELARALVAAGVDILDISPASAAAPGDRAAPFMALGVPVIAVGEMDRLERALETLAAGRASLVAVGRGLIADAEWPAKVAAGRLEEILVCTGCDECFGYLDRGEGVRCAVWDDQTQGVA